MQQETNQRNAQGAEPSGFAPWPHFHAEVVASLLELGEKGFNRTITLSSKLSKNQSISPFLIDVFNLKFICKMIFYFN